MLLPTRLSSKEIVLKRGPDCLILIDSSPAIVQPRQALFRGKFDKADTVDENLLNHVIWYATTDVARPYPGETKVQMPGEVRPVSHSEASED